MKQKIPQSVLNTVKKLTTADFEVFAVGGCVRDLLRKKEPRDWDLTTNAQPEELLKIFPEGKYNYQIGRASCRERV